MAIYIIEHLEPELWPWCLIEYKNISKIAGKNNLWFTNIKNGKDKKKIEQYGKVAEKSVKSLNLKNVCILDPDANKTLSPKEAKKFRYFIFGGILGDYPPKKRTKKELTPFVKGKARSIGKKQMSTDNAVYVVKKIVQGEDIKKIAFKDNVEININKIESTILPYRYALIDGKPLMSKEIVKYLKNKKEI